MNQELYNKLTQGIVTVTFKKINSDVRIIDCTLCKNIIPPPTPMAEGTVNRTKLANDNVQVVYDVINKAWRSFRWNSVTNFTTKE